MTIDRAIEILNPEHRENYDGMDEVNEACRMGVEDKNTVSALTLESLTPPPLSDGRRINRHAFGSLPSDAG